MQDIFVLTIGLIVFGYVSWKIFKLVTRKPGALDKCGGCTGCALKERINCNLK